MIYNRATVYMLFRKNLLSSKTNCPPVFQMKAFSDWSLPLSLLEQLVVSSSKHKTLMNFLIGTDILTCDERKPVHAETY